MLHIKGNYVSTEFLSKTIECRRIKEIANVKCWEIYLTIILYPINYFLAIKEKSRFSDERKQREFVVSRPTLKEWLRVSSNQKKNDKRRNFRISEREKNHDKQKYG